MNGQFVMRLGSILLALSLLASVACQGRDSSRETPPAGAWRAIGTEPFWGLDIDSTGLRFTTPDDTKGIRWPPLTPVVSGDSVRWVGETERAAVEVHIWPARCSDGMSDRVWPYEAVVRVEGTTYRGCAESRAGLQGADALGPWEGPGNRLFVKGPNELVTLWDGVFFDLRRE